MIGRRKALQALAVGSSAVAVSAPFAKAQGARSTWQQIMETKTLRVGCPISEPWYFKDISGREDPGLVRSGSDSWRGVVPVMAKQIADAMDVKLQIVETTFANAVAGMQANQFDFMLVLDPTPKRALSINFSSVPFLYYPLGLLVKTDLNATQWEELNDPKYKIGVALGSSQDQFITRVIPKATISRYQDNGAVIAAFQSGRVDASCLTGPTVDIARARLKAGKTLLPRPINAVATAAAFRYESDSRWKDYLNTSMSYYYNSGATQAAYEQFMAYRGLPAHDTTSIIKEHWPK